MRKGLSMVLVGVMAITFQAGSMFAATTDGLGVTQQSITSTSVSRGDAIVNEAKTWIGTPYKLWGNGPKGKNGSVDCSHFVNLVYKSAKLPYTYKTATSWAQNPNNPPYHLVKVTTPQKGDIVIFAPGGGTSYGHAGIYIDSKTFIGAQSKGVGYAKFGSYWGKARKIVGYYRYK